MLLLMPLFYNGCASTSGRENTSSNNPTQNNVAPNFTWQDGNGNISNLSDLRGKVVLLDFWATWCSPCKETIPHVEALYEKYKNQDVKIIGINVDTSASTTTIKQFVNTYGIHYQVIMDPRGNIASQYGVTSIPRFFIIDKYGNISKIFMGYDPNMENKISSEIDKFLQ
jgi:peroxiredoxin